MVASDKIQDAKDCFKEITQSGRNNYQKYDYFETKDIFPIVRRICKKYKLKTNILPDLEKQCFVLTITDREDNSFEQFFVPYSVVGGGDAGKFMQDFGRCQTYAMRYLYIQAFEIAVPDEIDGKDQSKRGVPKKKVTPRKTVKKSTLPIKPVKEETNKGEITAERIQHIISDSEKEWHNEQIKKLEKDRLPFTWENCKDLIKSHCRNEQEFNICKQSTAFKTADKIE